MDVDTREPRPLSAGLAEFNKHCLLVAQALSRYLVSPIFAYSALLYDATFELEPLRKQVRDCFPDHGSMICIRRKLVLRSLIEFVEDSLHRSLSV